LTGKTHQILGLTLGLGTYLAMANPVYGPATLGAVIAFSSIGALLPDIDNAAADIWHTIPFGHTAGKIVDPFIGHRNITHSLIGLLITSVCLYYLFRSFPEYWGINTSIVFISSMVAYLSHLFADSVTVEGIPLFWPAKWRFGILPKPFDGIRIMTGQWFENLIIFPLVNLSLFLLIISKWYIIELILFK